MHQLNRPPYIAVTQRNLIVDTRLMNLAVPSMQAPEFSMAPAVRCAPLNDLPNLLRPAGGYVVVGAGKSGVDACFTDEQWRLGR